MPRDEHSQTKRSLDSGGQEQPVYRVDQSHQAANRWFRREPGQTAQSVSQRAAEQARTDATTRVVLAPHAGADSRLERWLQRERAPRTPELPPERRPALQTPFERVIAQWLAQDDLRRAELEKLADLVLYGHRLRRRVLFVSLARELDIPRILLGTCLVARTGTQVLLIDGDAQQRTLTVLLQQEQELGLFEILRGGVSPEEVMVPLHTAGAALIPAGRWPSSEAVAEASTSLQSWQPAASVLIDGGLWPVPNLTTLLTGADHVFAVVRVDETRWSDFNELRRNLESSGRRLDGCLVAGDFE